MVPKNIMMINWDVTRYLFVSLFGLSYIHAVPYNISEVTSTAAAITIKQIKDGAAILSPSVNPWQSDFGTLPEHPIDFLTILSHKYGVNNDTWNQSHFKKLFGCITRMDGCPSTDLNEPSSFKQFSDCEINDSLSPLACQLFKKCGTIEDFFSMVDLNSNDTISTEEIHTLLPIILYQSQLGLCNKESFQEEIIKSKPKSSEVWGYGILFVTIISVSSLAGVSVLPLMARDFYQSILTCLVGLAVGSLAASSLFHLIPQAYGLTESKNGHHDYLLMSFFVLIGVFAFFLIERIIKLTVTQHKIRSKKLPTSLSAQGMMGVNSYGDVKINGHDTNGKVNGTANHCSSGGCKCVCNLSECGECQDFDTKESKPATCGSPDVQLIYASQEQAIKASFGHEQRPEVEHSHTVKFRQGEDSVIKTVAWMIIFGDGFHNFIDGVSIGAAFSENILTGISISLAVLCEELPHELGDFAVLLNSGMNMKQAIMYNFLSALTCYIGLILGILVGEFTQDSTYIFALAGGMFLYIALVDMLPEMNEVANRAAETSLYEAFKVLTLQILGFSTGIGILFALAYWQDSIIIGE